MTDIAAPASIARPGRIRPLSWIAATVRSIGRSYTNHLAGDQYIVPNGRLAAAARGASADA